MPAPETFVVVERNLLIPLPDGAHLAADLYRPALCRLARHHPCTSEP